MPPRDRWERLSEEAAEYWDDMDEPQGIGLLPSIVRLQTLDCCLCSGMHTADLVQSTSLAWRPGPVIDGVVSGRTQKDRKLGAIGSCAAVIGSKNLAQVVKA